MTIYMLPDTVLLEIFDSYRKNVSLRTWEIEWASLVHVCRRWRQIVFASPHRLKLRIHCKYGTPVLKDLGIWPAFPIVIDYTNLSHATSYDSEDSEGDIIAALKHPDRVCGLELEPRRNNPTVGNFGYCDAEAISGADASPYQKQQKQWIWTSPSL
jgi:hypothetical protein